MQQKTKADMLAEIARHTTGNKQEIAASRRAECVSCCAMLDAGEVRDWRDEWTSPERQNRVKRWTALCPRCGEPTVIGSASGLLEDHAYVPAANLMVTEQRKRGS